MGRMNKKIIPLCIVGLLLISVVCIIYFKPVVEEEECFGVSLYPNDAKTYHAGNIYEELEEYENSPEFNGYEFEYYGRACKI